MGAGALWHSIVLLAAIAAASASDGAACAHELRLRLAQAEGGGPAAVSPPLPVAAGENCATRTDAGAPQRYCASSTLPPSGGNQYRVANLFAGTTAQAWVEGRPGHGVGEWIVIEFAAPAVVRAVELRNGYHKSADLFAKNGRVKELRLLFSTGETRTVAPRDSMDVQTFAIDPPVTAAWVQFVIEDVVPGSVYSDTAITKLTVTTAPAR